MTDEPPRRSWPSTEAPLVPRSGTHTITVLRESLVVRSGSVSDYSIRLGGGSRLLRRCEDLVARDEPVAHLDHATNVHRVEKLIRCDLAAAHHQRQDEAGWRVRLDRGQRHSLLSAVSFGVLRGELARAVLSQEGSAARKFDHAVIGRQSRCAIPIRRRRRFDVAMYDVFGGSHRE